MKHKYANKKKAKNKYLNNPPIINNNKPRKIAISIKFSKK